MNVDRVNSVWQEIRPQAELLGDTLEKHYPRNEGEPPSINREHLEELTDHLIMVIAEVIQAWIDAGSEREVTMENEELRKAIHNELEGW